jgi:hypothetical protein
MSIWTEERVLEHVELPGAAEPPDPATLEEFEASRRAIVLSYCSWLCDPDRVEEAAEAAFAELVRVLEAAGAGPPVDIDAVLWQTTRDAAADRVPPASGGEALLRRASGRGATCSLMPRLLSARAGGRLSDADAHTLSAHLARCSGCSSLEQRHEEAERAYMALLREPGLEPAKRRRGVVDDPPSAAPIDPATSLPPSPHVQTGAQAAPRRSSSSRRTVAGTILGLVLGAVAAVAILLGGGSKSSDRTGAVSEPAATRQAATPVAPQSPATDRRAAARERRRARLAALGDRMLGPGATGPDVKALQRLLGLPRTGTYGPETQAAVMRFQQANSLNADGNAGDRTKRLLARRPPAG